MTQDEIKFQKLRRFNIVMGVLHTIQGILMLAFTNDFAVPFTTNFLKFDEINETVYHNMNELWEIQLGPAVALFMFMSAFAHFSVSTYGYGWYQRKLKEGINPARWYEYAVSSSWMILIVAMLSGLTDLAALILLVGLNASMNLFGMMMELHNKELKKTNWSSFIYGSIAGTLAWVAVLMYFLGAILDNFDNVPNFVYMVVFVLLFFWGTFPLNMWLQYRRKGRWADYLYGEKVYILLSLVSKSALAWFIFFGVQGIGS